VLNLQHVAVSRSKAGDFHRKVTQILVDDTVNETVLTSDVFLDSARYTLYSSNKRKHCLWYWCEWWVLSILTQESGYL